MNYIKVPIKQAKKMHECCSFTWEDTKKIWEGNGFLETEIDEAERLWDEQKHNETFDFEFVNKLVGLYKNGIRRNVNK